MNLPLLGQCGANFEHSIRTRDYLTAERSNDLAAMVLAGEGTLRDLLGGDQAELRDLGADLLERSARLCLDLTARLLEAALAVGLGVLAHAALVRLANLPRLGEDLLGLALRLRDQLTVLFEKIPRLAARVIRLLE